MGLFFGFVFQLLQVNIYLNFSNKVKPQQAYSKLYPEYQVKGITDELVQVRNPEYTKRKYLSPQVSHTVFPYNYSDAPQYCCCKHVGFSDSTALSLTVIKHLCLRKLLWIFLLTAEMMNWRNNLYKMKLILIHLIYISGKFHMSS